ncbi:MAG: hypothetical protein ACLPID_11825, partial [Beijerinckiaceae bacterium]
SKIIVIDSKKLERDFSGKPASTFPHPALGSESELRKKIRASYPNNSNSRSFPDMRRFGRKPSRSNQRLAQRALWLPSQSGAFFVCLQAQK